MDIFAPRWVATEHVPGSRTDLRVAETGGSVLAIVRTREAGLGGEG